MTPYIFQRGETISLALDALSGDPLTVGDISAVMKAVAPGRTSADESTPIAAAFEIVPREADGETPAGWTLTIPASVSSNLQPGSYVSDARLEIAGGVVITDNIALRIKQSVSA